MVRIKVLHERSAIYDSKRSKRNTGMIGLENQGATCYLNSLLQTLFHTNALRKALYELDTSADVAKESVALEMQRLFASLQLDEVASSTKEVSRGGRRSSLTSRSSPGRSDGQIARHSRSTTCKVGW